VKSRATSGRGAFPATRITGIGGDGIGGEGNQKEGQNWELSDSLAPDGRRALCFDKKWEIFLRLKRWDGGSTYLGKKHRLFPFKEKTKLEVRVKKKSKARAVPHILNIIPNSKPEDNTEPHI
jgi:hypothetical protein